MFERDLRTLSFVPRWVITRNIKTQSVAEHSFFVAVYAGQLAEYLGFEGDMADLYHAALWHDAEESFTGDVPGPAKRSTFGSGAAVWIRAGMSIRFPSQDRPVTSEIKTILKVANLLDEVLYKATEIQMGNRGAMHSFLLSRQRLMDSLFALVLTNPGLADLKTRVVDAIDLHMAGQDKLPENNSDVAINP